MKNKITKRNIKKRKIMYGGAPVRVEYKNTNTPESESLYVNTFEYTPASTYRDLAIFIRTQLNQYLQETGQPSYDDVFHVHIENPPPHPPTSLSFLDAESDEYVTNIMSDDIISDDSISVEPRQITVLPCNPSDILNITIHPPILETPLQLRRIVAKPTIKDLIEYCSTIYRPNSPAEAGVVLDFIVTRKRVGSPIVEYNLKDHPIKVEDFIKDGDVFHFRRKDGKPFIPIQMSSGLASLDSPYFSFAPASDEYTASLGSSQDLSSSFIKQTIISYININVRDEDMKEKLLSLIEGLSHEQCQKFLKFITTVEGRTASEEGVMEKFTQLYFVLEENRDNLPRMRAIFYDFVDKIQLSRGGYKKNTRKQYKKTRKNRKNRKN
jgi:hypothetical protein